MTGEPTGGSDAKRANAEGGADQTLEFVEKLTSALQDIIGERHRRTLTLYYGLDGNGACTLEVIAREFGVSRERARQLRVRAIEVLVWRAMGPSASERCRGLVGHARMLADQFKDDPLGLLDAFEAGAVTRRADDWVTLVLGLAGTSSRKARSLAGEARRNQRAALLAAETERRARWKAEHAEERRSARLANFLDRAVWPSTTRRDWRIEVFSAQRDVHGDLGRSGSFQSEKLGRTVQYESGLELAFLSQVDTAGDVVGYQEQPLAVDYAFEARRRRYIPDAVVVFDDGRALVVEIKPRLQMALVGNLRKWVAMARWCGEHGAGLLIGDGRVSVTDVLLVQRDDEFCARLRDAIDEKPLNYFAYRRGVGKDRSTHDLAAAVSAGLVSWELSPFLVRASTPDESSDARAFSKLLRDHPPANAPGL